MALVFAERGEGAVVLLDDPVEDGPLWFTAAVLPHQTREICSSSSSASTGARMPAA